MAALTACETFFAKADAEDGMWPETDSGSSSSSSSPQGLATIIRSQVLQSGLMGTFAAAMTAAADSILTVNDREPPLQDATQICYPYMGRAVTADRAAGGSGRHDELLRSLFWRQVSTSAQWLTTWSHVCRLWPEGNERLAVIAVAAPAAVRLSAAIMQVVSRDLPAAVKAAAAAAAAAADAQGGPAVQGTSGDVRTDICLLYDSVNAVLKSVSWLAYNVVEYEDGGTSFWHMPALQPLLTCRSSQQCLPP